MRGQGGMIGKGKNLWPNVHVDDGEHLFLQYFFAVLLTMVARIVNYSCGPLQCPLEQDPRGPGFSAARTRGLLFRRVRRVPAVRRDEGRRRGASHDWKRPESRADDVYPGGAAHVLWRRCPNLYGIYYVDKYIDRIC